MSAASLSGLQLKLLEAIKSKGVIQELKSNLRHKLITELFVVTSQQQEIVSNNDCPDFDKIAYSLCLDYLKMNNFSFSLSVFVPEAGIQAGAIFSRIELINFLKFKELCNNNEHKLLILSDPSTSLLQNIVSFLMSLAMTDTKDECIQTEFDFNVFCYDNQIREIDTKFSNQRIADPEVVRMTFMDKVHQCRQQIEAQLQKDFCIKALDFKQNAVNEIRKEVELSAMALLNEKQTRLEEIYMGQKAILDQREQYFNKKLEDDREANEHATFLQRQMLAAEIEATRLRADKVRQAEIEFERLKKSLQEDIHGRQAQLEQKEQKLLCREQDVDKFIKMEVERLRKSDEIDLLQRKRELEVAESRNLVERNTLEAQRRQLLALQEEVSEKSALFSQMEIADYKALQMKLSAATNEINLLKEHLGQAFEEIERLAGDTATVHSERNRLTVMRQENERLRAMLEQEQTDNRHERIKLNLKIEDLASENSQLNERICLQERELSRLRARLVEVRSAQIPTSTITAQAPDPFADSSIDIKEQFSGESKAPTMSATFGDLRAPSAVIQTARNRLKLLEQESSEIEEALGRWRKEASEVLEVQKDAREMASCIQQAGPITKRTSLSTAYLARFRPSVIIPTVYRPSPSWPMTSVRPVNGVSETTRGVIAEATSGGTSDLTVLPQSLNYEQQPAIGKLTSLPPQNRQNVASNDSSQGGTIPQTTGSHPPASAVHTQLTDLNVNQKKLTFQTTEIATMGSSEASPGPPQSTPTSVQQEICPKFQQDLTSPRETFQNTKQNISQNIQLETLAPINMKVNEELHLTQESKVPVGDSDIEIPCVPSKQMTNGGYLNSNIIDARGSSAGNGDHQSVAVLGDNFTLSDEPEKRSSKGGSCQDQSEDTGSHFDAPSDTGIDPMILKYMKSVKEQRTTQEEVVESVFPRESGRQTDAPFSTPFYSEQLSSDVSNGGEASKGMSGGNAVDWKSEKCDSSDEFW